MPTVANSTFDTTGRRPTWAEIDLDALAQNFYVIKNRVGQNVKVMAIVKANAYGHGAVECARRLVQEGADWFGVALPEEGVELRAAGITQPILCLGGFWNGQAGVCVQEKLVPVVFRLDQIEALDLAARDAGIIADVHVKIDTGMGRLGIRFEDVTEFADALGRFKNIRVDGLITHFAAADDPTHETLTKAQIERFEHAVRLFRDRGHEPTYIHSCNSAGIFSHTEAFGNMVRPGGVLYGLWRDVLPPSTTKSALRPVMTLHSKIMFLKWVPEGETIGYGGTFKTSRKTLVATIPIGYDDGYLRGLSNRSQVIVRETHAPVIGRISMDLTILDVTDVVGVELGDTATLFGCDQEMQVTVEELAGIAGTLSYEVTCGIGGRVPRIYLP